MKKLSDLDRYTIIMTVIIIAIMALVDKLKNLQTLKT